MPDDLAITPGAGGIVATDEVGGRHFQRVKVTFGNDGAAVDANGNNPLPVVLSPASDETETAAVTNVAASATVVTVLAANSGRLGGSVFNDSTAVLYLKFGIGASATSHTVQLEGGDFYELPLLARGRVYRGAITGLWASAVGTARVTEVS